MVSDQNRADGGGLLSGLRESGHLRNFGLLAALVVLASALLTMFDRRFDKKFPPRWRDGIAESFHSVMSLASSGRSNGKNLFGWLGRIWSGLWLRCGVAVIAYVTSPVTSVMTTMSLARSINGPGDLPGKVVGVLED